MHFPRAVLGLIDRAYALRRLWRGHRICGAEPAQEGLALSCALEGLREGRLQNLANRKLGKPPDELSQLWQFGKQDLLMAQAWRLLPDCRNGKNSDNADMNQEKVDVFGIGNALVDILVMVDDDFIREHALTKGSMTLMDSEKQGALLQDLREHDLQMRSGGSAANTVIAVAHSGGSGFYTGKVARDLNGEFYRQDLLELGIHFDVHPAPEVGPPTGTCLVLTTKDAERTMCTHLGVSTGLTPADIDLERMKRSRYVYIEGYLWDPPDPRAASIRAMELAKKHGLTVAFTFSDLFLVERFGNEFRHVLDEYCDIVFCNADEARHFTELSSLEDAARRIGQLVKQVFVTDSANGCLLVHDGELTRVPGFSVQAIDTVGAGDAFAGGVLFGLSRGYAPPAAARWGNYLASRVVMHRGARLPHPVREHVAAILAAN